MTTAELITQVRTRFGEDSTSATQVTDAQILSFLNASQREMAAESNILLTCATSSTVAGQEEYPLPSDYHKVQAVFLYRTTGDLSKQNLYPIGILDRDPAKAQGTPRNYYIWGLNVSGNNSFTIGLSPIPIASGSSDLEVFYRQIPSTMVSGGQGPEIPVQFQDGLPDGALMQVYERFSSGDSGYMAMADRARSRWGSWIARASSHVSPLTLDRPSMPRDTMGYTRPAW